MLEKASDSSLEPKILNLSDVHEMIDSIKAQSKLAQS